MQPEKVFEKCCNLENKIDAKIPEHNKVKKDAQIQVNAVAYFKNNEGFKRLFEGFKEKYSSLGYVGGIVKLTALREDEKQALAGFMGKDLAKQKTASIAVAGFQKSINNSRFEGISVEWLVKAYFDGQLLYKKDVRQQAECEQKKFFEKLLVESGIDEKTTEWLEGVVSAKLAPYGQMMQEYNEDRDVFFKLMTRVLQGISILPTCNNKIDCKDETQKSNNDENRILNRNVEIPEQCENVDLQGQRDKPLECKSRQEKEALDCENENRSLNGNEEMLSRLMRLPVFATKITGDPHYFDKNGKAYIYLLHGAYHRVNGRFMTNVSLNAEEEAEILYKAGLMRDDISNFVMCYGIRGVIKTDNLSHTSIGTENKDNGKLEEHRGLNGFFDLGEPSMLSLLNINKLATAYSVNNKVFVFENPSVFAEFIDADRQHCKVSAICSAGQPNLAVLLILDLLVASGTGIYYSGDFDPEGLLIADRLKLRYGEMLNPWHFGLEDYNFAMSEKHISEKRLKQLEKVQDVELKKVAEVMKKIKKAGYQEKLIERIIRSN